MSPIRRKGQKPGLVRKKVESAKSGLRRKEKVPAKPEPRSRLTQHGVQKKQKRVEVLHNHCWPLPRKTYADPDGKFPGTVLVLPKHVPKHSDLPRIDPIVNRLGKTEIRLWKKNGVFHTFITTIKSERGDYRIAWAGCSRCYNHAIHCTCPQGCLHSNGVEYCYVMDQIRIHDKDEIPHPGFRFYKGHHLVEKYGVYHYRKAGRESGSVTGERDYTPRGAVRPAESHTAPAKPGLRRKGTQQPEKKPAIRRKGQTEQQRFERAEEDLQAITGKRRLFPKDDWKTVKPDIDLQGLRAAKRGDDMLNSIEVPPAAKPKPKPKIKRKK